MGRKKSFKTTTKINKVLVNVENPSREFKNIILCGDINLDANKFNDPKYKNHEEADLLLNGLANIGFSENLIKENTFFSKCGKHISRLDLVFTTLHNIEETVDHNMVADHKGTLITIPIKGYISTKDPPTSIMNYKNINFKALKNDFVKME